MSLTFGAMLALAAGSAVGTGAANLGVSAFNNAQTWNYQQKYMDKYGSPQAQMKNMVEAGINPFTAAGNISGAVGQSNVVSNAAPIENPLPTFSEMANSQLNDVVSRNTEATTSNVKASTEGMSYDNVFKGQTLSYNISKSASEAGMSAYEASMMGYRAQHYPELFDKTMTQIDTEIKKNRAMSYMYDAQVNMLSYQMQEISYNIKVLENQSKLLKSEQELADMNKMLTYWQSQLAYVGFQKSQIEYDRYSRSADAPAFIQKYDEIYEKEGPEAAEEWKNREFQVVSDYNEKVAQGQSRGSDPYLADLWSKYDSIVSAEDEYDALNAVYKDATDEVTRALNFGTTEEYLEKQAALDRMAQVVVEAKKNIDDAVKVFQKGNEFRGYRDPNKFYKEDWIRIGSEIAKDLVIIYSAKNVGAKAIPGQKGVSGEDIKKGLKNAGRGTNLGDLMKQTPMPGNYGMPTIAW